MTSTISNRQRDRALGCIPIVAVQHHTCFVDAPGKPVEPFHEVTVSAFDPLEPETTVMHSIRFTNTHHRAEQIAQALATLLVAGLIVTVTNSDGSAIKMVDSNA